MARITDEELAQVILQHLHNAEGYDYSTDELQRERELALDYYLGRTRSDVPALAELEGRSSVKSTDVHDMVNAVLAQVMPAFCNDQPAAFEPDGADDEAQAALETDAVSRVLMEDNSGYQVLYGAVKDALLLKNGVVKVWCDEGTEADVRTLSGVDAETLALVEGEGWEVTERDMRRGSATIRRDTDYKRVKVEAVAPENFFTQAGWTSTDLQDVPFCGERCQWSRGEIAEQYGAAVADALQSSGGDQYPSQYARQVDKSYDAPDAATRDQDRIEVIDCYLMIDLAGGLKPSRYFVRLAGQTVLEKSPADFVPYAAGAAFLMPHRFAGESLFDKIRHIQDAKTGVLRAWLDNLNLNNHDRLIVGPGVNTQDLANSGPGRHVRADDVGQVVPMPRNDTGGSAQAALGYLDTVTTRRAGAALEMQSGEAQLVKSQIGSMGADRIMSAQEQLAGLMTRTLAETLVRNTFRLVHTVLRREYDRPMTLRRAGQWQQVMPATWRARTRINVKAGMSPGERNRKVGNLQFLLQTHLTLMQAGKAGILTDDQTLHRLLLDWGRAADLDNPEAYFIDPASPQAQQAAQMMAAQAQEQQQLQIQLATLADTLKAQQEQQRLQFDYFKARLDAEVEEAKLLGKATLDLELAQLEAETRADRGTEPAAAAAA